MAGTRLAARAEDTQEDQAKAGSPLPVRTLGRTGADVSILTLGAGRPPSARMLNAAYDTGIRCIDTAASYGNQASEREIGRWMAEKANRKEIFIISKDRPEVPDQWSAMVDRSLKTLQTDYVDLYLVHSLGGRGWLGTVKKDREIPLQKEWAAAADKLKKSGRVRFVGFTTHAEVQIRADLLNNAATGGWVDAVMVSYDPQLVRENADYNKAVDACHKAGVGLICMKEMRAVNDMPKILPEFKDLGLSPYQAVLHAVWTDARITTTTSEMLNLSMWRENSKAARIFKPLDSAKIEAVVGLYQRYGRRFCNACDGSCRRAGRTKAALNDIVRALSYYERDGRLDEARRVYASLSEDERDWHGADLAAASAACHCNLDFATLLPRAEEKLA
jgi:aryl-alcohol dehydrogenase-like predicted oxidoreductase